MYSQMIEYRATKRFADDISYLNTLDTEELLQRNNELLRRLAGARDELKKFKAGLDVLRPWMDEAQKKLIEKEEYLKNFDKIDKCFESTTVFVSDVIKHQADLNLITNSAQNFIEQFQSYLSYSKEYRSIPAKKRIRIESISLMEDELSDMVAAITSEFRELLLRVHGLLSNELSGLSVKQKKYKEAVNKAGAWLNKAERRCNELLSEPAASDVSILKRQLSLTLAVNDDFVSRGSLISDAKKILKTLLRSLEGQLSFDEMANVKNPYIEIENKYDRLLKALNERCQTLDIVLVESNRLRTKSAVSINEESAELLRSNTEQEIRGEVERSINEQHIESNTGNILTKTTHTKDFSQNGSEKEVIPESETLIKAKAIIESSSEDGKDELEEGECVSPVEFPPKDLVAKITDQSETPVNVLVTGVEEISNDSFLEDKHNQVEEGNAAPEILNTVRGYATGYKRTLLGNIEEISEDSFSDGKNYIEDENNIILETATSVESPSIGPELRSLENEGSVRKSKKNASSDQPAIDEKMNVDFISDSECFSFEYTNEVTGSNLRDKKNPELETSTSELKIADDAESNSFEAVDESSRDDLQVNENNLKAQIDVTLETSTNEPKLAAASPENISSEGGNGLPQVDFKKKNDARPVTPTTKQNIEHNMECTLLKAADTALDNSSVKAVDGLPQYVLEKESSPDSVTPATEQNIEPESHSEKKCSVTPVVPPTEQNTDRNLLEFTRIALVENFAAALDDLAEEIDESEKIMDISLNIKTSLVQSKPQSFIIQQETLVSEKPKDTSPSCQSEVNSSSEDSREDSSELLVNISPQSEVLNNEDESQEVSSESNLFTETASSSQPEVTDNTEEIKDHSEAILFSDTASSSQSQVIDFIEKIEEHPPAPNLFIDSTPSWQSNANHNSEKAEEYTSEPKKIASQVVDDLLKEHLVVRQPVILLYDIGKDLMKESTRQRAEGLRRRNLRPTKPNELRLYTYTKDFIQIADTLSRKKKSFKVDPKKHPVSLLQEYCTYYNFTLPQYRVESTFQDSSKTNLFLTSVTVKNKNYTTKVPLIRKKDSKMEAAKLCLQDLGLLSER